MKILCGPSANSAALRSRTAASPTGRSKRRDAEDAEQRRAPISRNPWECTLTGSTGLTRFRAAPAAQESPSRQSCHQVRQTASRRPRQANHPAIAREDPASPIRLTPNRSSDTVVIDGARRTPPRDTQAGFFPFFDELRRLNWLYQIIRRSCFHSLSTAEISMSMPCVKPSKIWPHALTSQKKNDTNCSQAGASPCSTIGSDGQGRT